MLLNTNPSEAFAYATEKLSKTPVLCLPTPTEICRGTVSWVQWAAVSTYFSDRIPHLLEICLSIIGKRSLTQAILIFHT